MSRGNETRKRDMRDMPGPTGSMEEERGVNTCVGVSWKSAGRSMRGHTPNREQRWSGRNRPGGLGSPGMGALLARQTDRQSEWEIKSKRDRDQRPRSSAS